MLPEAAEVYVPEGGDLAVDRSSRLGYDDAGVYMYLLAHPFFESFPYEEGLIERRLNTALGVAKHERFYIPSPVRGGGHGKRMMRRAAGLYDALGITVVELTAQSVGKYLWANCGFDFASAGDRVTVNIAARDFAMELGIVEEWADLQHPWHFAALNVQDGEEVLIPWQAVADVLERRGEPGLQPPMRSEGIAPAKALLIHSRYPEWNGRLDLSSESTGRACLMAYAEGYE
jgi:GNAT superfamily N-acetyltransferase